MTRIGFNPSTPGTGATKIRRNKTSRIEYLKCEIEKVNYLIQTGIISQEEGNAKIRDLENQIKELEYGIPDGSDIEIIDKENIPALGSPLDINEDSEKSSNKDAEAQNDNTYGHNDYYSQQSVVNRAYHNLL